MPSNARLALETRLRDVDQLMAAHETVGGLEPGRRYDVEGLNRAAILMLCAHFEGYIEDVMREALGALNPTLDATPLVAGFHNPWPDRIDELFAFLGMSSPSKTISWQRASNASVRDNLGNLVRTRNRIAHGTTGVSVHKADVTRYRKYVDGFATRFDALLRTRVRTLTGAYPWPT